ncbi:hypothetical protein [Nonomuraea sp. NPDC003804]|uniref:HNH endonuclease n=1 Tax=Nonomuraea sp. NPDC003804 TaxID=3154547 RepID=UPI0033B1B393
MTVTQKVRDLVKDRDGHACVACGKSIIGRPHSLQHRRARKAGGARLPWIDQPQNLVTVCGSATSPDGCHYQVMESRDPSRDADTLGYVISEWPELDPKFIPVHVVTEFGTAKVWLTPEGGLADHPPADEATWQDLLFCGSCRSVRLHHFDGDTAACIRCGGVTDTNPDLIVPVIDLRYCHWCHKTLPVGHECKPDETPCQRKTGLWPCGMCEVCTAAQMRTVAQWEAS